MITIWGRDNSVNVKKVLWCLEELELPHEHIAAGGAHGVVDTPEYRAMNPNGLVPCIKDGDFILWESNTIVRYLCAVYGKGSLIPGNARETARASQWMDWASWSVGRPYSDIVYNLIRKPEGQRDMAVVEKAIRAWNHHLPIADAALADQPFLAGDSFTMADIPLGCLVYGWLHIPIERPELPHLQAWAERLATRPAYRAHVMLPMT